MKIFVDETGNFKPDVERDSLSGVGALWVPDSSYSFLIRKFRKLRKRFDPSGAEVKGSSLTEAQVEQVVRLLIECDVLVFIAFTNAYEHTSQMISSHKDRQVAALTRAIEDSKEVDPDFSNSLQGVTEKLKNFSLPQYSQAALQTAVLDRSLRLGTLYYARKVPHSLGSFEWVIDAKEKKVITNFEAAWRESIPPVVAYRGRIEPAYFGTDFDYSHMNKFRRGDKFELKEIFENIRFTDSVASEGIQLVDIVLAAVRKTFLGKFDLRQCPNLAAIVAENEAGKHAVPFLVFKEAGVGRAFGSISEYFDRNAKPILGPS